VKVLAPLAAVAFLLVGLLVLLVAALRGLAIFAVASFRLGMSGTTITAD
jgi:hypothetical protein